MTQEALPVVAHAGLDAKREVAKDYLGPRYVNHPQYRFDPRHSNSPDIYVPARQQYLRSVAETARLDRSNNPAFARHECLRAALAIPTL